jgi:hypothetical protein
MDDPTDVSSQNGSGRHTLDEGSSTRNRKVLDWSLAPLRDVGVPPASGLDRVGATVLLSLVIDPDDTERKPRWEDYPTARTPGGIQDPSMIDGALSFGQ